ncbi:hypothetical protein MMC28_008144 [Mycoblastus sanguinarius]|nr:hypothetical protein [Mycoblastus sanguinarius]
MATTSSQSQGDTQPVSQWVYDELSSRSKEVQDAKHDRGGEHQNAFHTLHTGETGHIDLIGVFEQPSIEDGEEQAVHHDDDDIDPLSQAMDVRADIFPEFKRFQQPRTPATQGKKRKRNNDAIPVDTTTPKLPRNPFAGRTGSTNDDLMGPSQLFNATQALTSPLANDVPSDGLSERPSPDMHNIQRPSTADPLSSPAKLPRSNMVRAVTEPQTVYISMKESQEAREKRFRELEEEQARARAELSDDDFGSADTQLRRRLKQKKITEEARRQFAGIKGRSAPKSGGRGRVRGGNTGKAPNRETPRRPGRDASRAVIISDDPPAEEAQGSITEDETEQEEDVPIEEENDMDDLADDNKENVEVPRTISRANQGTSQVITSQPTPCHRPPQKPSPPDLTGRISSYVESSSQITRSQQTTRIAESGTQPDAVVDSQDSQQHAKPKQASDTRGSKAFPEPHASLDSPILVPQSQSSEAYKALQALAKRPGLQGQDRPSTTDPQSRSLQSTAKERVVTEHQEALQLGRSEVEKEGRSNVLQVESSSESLPRSEAASRTQTSALPISRAQDTESSTVHVPRQRSTISETNSAAKVHHIDQGPVHDSTSIMPSPRTTPKSVSKAASSLSVTDQSRASTLFETAREHLINSPSKSLPRSQRRSQSSPAKSRRPRTIDEIAADPSPSNAIGSVDVDINILSNDDIEFQTAICGSSPIVPPQKRRRGGKGQALQVAIPEPNQLPPPPHSPLPPPSSAFSDITPLASSEAEATSPPKAENTMRNVPLKASVISSGKKRLMSKATSIRKHSKTPPVPNVDVNTLVTRSENPSSKEIAPRRLPSEIGNELAVSAPNRVFAHFNGNSPAYYPATCLEMISDAEPRYRVRFDDGTIDVIGGYGIKKLELQVGDVVKVDRPGARKENFVVRGMQDLQHPTIPLDPETPSRRGRMASTNSPAFPETDIHGYATVVLSPKPRNSVGGDQSDSLQIVVPLTRIYFTQTMWTALKDRLYIHTPNKLQTLTGLQTPSERPSTPSTPSSRTRRARTSGFAVSRSMTSTNSGDGIFKNMAFAITNIDDKEESERTRSHILSNGGNVLLDGFDELFHIPALTRTTSHKKNMDNSFHLTPAAKDLGFTCLIANKHCRRAKFIQALALGIPCLATRWIKDCVSKQSVLPWAPYLLPSGESSFLGGAISSRALQPFPAESSRLSDIVENRTKLLDDASVLVIMEKSQENTMKFHPLITHALGASTVSRAIDDDAAAKSVADAQALGEPWDWVFSYDKEKDVEKKLFGGSGTGKKRKRGRESEMHDLPSNKAKTRVVGNEFVIQSLMLGMLADD